MVGIEPTTYSFAYTSVSLSRRARLYLNPLPDSLVSRSPGIAFLVLHSFSDGGSDVGTVLSV